VPKAGEERVQMAPWGALIETLWVEPLVTVAQPAHRTSKHDSAKRCPP
jgi:hypothetical protein